MKIVLLPEVAMALETAVSQTRGKEFSGFGFAIVEGNAVMVYDYAILNVGSEGYTEIPAEEILKLSEREDAENLRVWFHRHPIGNGQPGEHNWSGLDRETITTAPFGSIPELVKWSASIVRTPRGWVGRIDNHINKTVAHVEVEPKVPVEVFNTIDRLSTERMEKLVERLKREYGPAVVRYPMTDQEYSQLFMNGFDLEGERAEEMLFPDEDLVEADLEDEWQDEYLEGDATSRSRRMKRWGGR
ncbi:MAG: hypothetical protein EHM35_08545 [Planctomycetaceae bacterium]|nr:MAG: hypothetical protein EHM35_08545 [Planctomycetaceae bacterium]